MCDSIFHFLYMAASFGTHCATYNNTRVYKYSVIYSVGKGEFLFQLEIWNSVKLDRFGLGKFKPYGPTSTSNHNNFETLFNPRTHYTRTRCPPNSQKVKLISSIEQASFSTIYHYYWFYHNSIYGAVTPNSKFSPPEKVYSHNKFVKKIWHFGRLLMVMVGKNADAVNYQWSKAA